MNGNFDPFRIKSDENPFYVIILRFAEFPQMFVWSSRGGRLLGLLALRLLALSLRALHPLISEF